MSYKPNLSRTLRIAIVLACIVAVVSTLGACAKSKGTPVEIGNRLQILHIGNGDEPADIDPHITTGLPERRIQVALFEGLVTKTADSLQPAPGVAESWTVSDDGLIYRFQFNPAARWSNGEPITPDDFIWSWQRALTPALGNQYAQSFYPIRNAEAFHKGEISDFAEVGVRALDARTLEIELIAPTPYFLELLDHHSLYPVHRATVEKFGGTSRRGTAWTRPENFVGNGAFVLAQWQPNRVLVVKKNPLYWGADSVRLQEIHFHPVQEGATDERMFRTGQLHVAGLAANLPPERVADYRAQQHPALRSYPVLSTYFFIFNTQRPALGDARVRRALAYAIDREQIVSRVTRGGETPAYHMTPPNTAGYNARARFEPDLDKARALLAEAGYPNGEGFPRLSILFNTMESHHRIAVVMQQMWKQELNIDVTLQNKEWRVYLADKRTGDFDISRSGWLGDYYDPNTFLDMFISDGGNNYSGWASAEYDALIAEAARTADPAARYELFQQAEELLLAEMPITPLYFYSRNNLVAPSVRNWHTNVMEHIDFRPLYLHADGD